MPGEKAGHRGTAKQMIYWSTSGFKKGGRIPTQCLGDDTIDQTSRRLGRWASPQNIPQGYSLIKNLASRFRVTKQSLYRTMKFGWPHNGLLAETIEQLLKFHKGKA